MSFFVIREFWKFGDPQNRGFYFHYRIVQKHKFIFFTILTHTHIFLMFWVVLIIRRRSRRDLHKVSLQRPFFKKKFVTKFCTYTIIESIFLCCKFLLFIPKSSPYFQEKNCLNSPYLYQVISSNNKEKTSKTLSHSLQYGFNATSLVWPMWLLQVWSVSSPLNLFLLAKPASFLYNLVEFSIKKITPNSFKSLPHISNNMTTFETW